MKRLRDEGKNTLFALLLSRKFLFPIMSHIHENKWQKPAFEGYERVQQGNAIITKMELADWPWSSPAQNYPGYGKLVPISTQISQASLYSSGNRDMEPRNLLVVPLKISEKISLYFIATHLTALSGEDRHNQETPRTQQASIVRLAQAKEILRIVDELRQAEDKSESKSEHRPIILAGDFNARPGSPEINKLEQAFLRHPPRWDSSVAKEVWTHIGFKIYADYIFYNDPHALLTPKDCFILEQSQVGDVTDHLPVEAKFTL